jgi:hypothetical protein
MPVPYKGSIRGIVTDRQIIQKWLPLILLPWISTLMDPGSVQDPIAS